MFLTIFFQSFLKYFENILCLLGSPVREGHSPVRDGLIPVREGHSHVRDGLIPV